jgi:threonine/homoserine/homoserine lactone efflux protein
VIAEIATLALGIAASPFPVIPAILLLFTPRPRATGGAFLLGWVVGIAAACGVFIALASVIEMYEEAPTWASWVRIAVGALLVALAVWEWRSREAETEPAWMQALESATPASALRLGLLLSAANPKILALAAAGGLVIGSAELNRAQTAGAMIVFTAIASSTVALPWLLFFLLGDRILTPLGRTRDWLKANNAAIMAVVLTVLGVLLLSKGITDL